MPVVELEVTFPRNLSFSMTQKFTEMKFWFLLLKWLKSRHLYIMMLTVQY